MGERSGDNDSPPQQIGRFQWLWFSGMVIGAAYDCAVAVVGDPREAWIDILFFAVAAALLHYTVRRRSNFARLLVIPFLAMSLVEVLSHQGFDTSQLATSWLAILQLGLMGAAGWLLFTPAARCWFARGAS